MIDRKDKEFVCEQYSYYCPCCKYGYIYKSYEMPDDYEEWNCLITEEQLEKERIEDEKNSSR